MCENLFLLIAKLIFVTYLVCPWNPSDHPVVEAKPHIPWHPLFNLITAWLRSKPKSFDNSTKPLDAAVPFLESLLPTSSNSTSIIACPNYSNPLHQSPGRLTTVQTCCWALTLVTYLSFFSLPLTVEHGSPGFVIVGRSEVCIMYSEMHQAQSCYRTVL